MPPPGNKPVEEPCLLPWPSRAREFLFPPRPKAEAAAPERGSPAAGRALRWLCLAAAVLSGCAGFPPAMYLSPGEGHVVFTADEFRGVLPEGVRYYATQQTEEYLLFRGEGAMAELIFDVMYEFGTADEADALKFPRYEQKARIEAWNANRGRAKRWGTRKTLSTDSGPYFTDPEEFSYIPYVLTDTGHRCFGFEAMWDQPGHDPEFSPRKLLFGYYCEAPGEPLTDERIAQLLGSIHIRITPEPLEASSPASRAGATGARGDIVPLNLARGASSRADSGNPEFPFVFEIVHGQPGNGDGNGGGMN